MDGWLDEWMDGWMDGWLDELMNESNGKINFYKLYRQVASYADALRASLSVWGKNAQRSSKKTSAWEVNEQASVAQRLDNNNNNNNNNNNQFIEPFGSV